MKPVIAVLAFVLLSGGACAQRSAACDGLAAMKLPQGQVLEAAMVGPAMTGRIVPGGKPVTPLPPYCRVSARLMPTADSDIRIEVWLPLEWNGRFRGQGNGGFAGVIDHQALSRAVAQGYATAGTDTGHASQSRDASTDASWALGHPEKIADFGWRGIHEMTVAAQAIVAAFYGRPAAHSFFSACSDGGREALMEAQRFPADYDGIIAGAPAYNWTALVSSSLAGARALSAPGGYLPPSKLPALSAAVLNACDAKDGLKDGVLNDPRACRFDPAVLVCKEGDTATIDACLTRAQVKTVATLYAGARRADGSQILPGYLPGAELGPGGWSAWVTGDALGKGLGFAFGQGYFRNMVYSDPGWTIDSVTLDGAYAKANETTAVALNATDTNLAPFFGRGGKLILYHGWNDPAIPSLGTVDYVGRMTQASGAAAASSSRLYMVPGMQHCGGGPGAATSFGQGGWTAALGVDDARHDVGLALEQWVEKGDAPGVMVASRYAASAEGEDMRVVMQRPLCPYPQTAVYDGVGDPALVGSFKCVAQ